MKIVIYILLLLVFSPQVLGQEWRDTLHQARKSYKQQDYGKSFRLYRSARKLAPKEIDLADEVAQSAYKAGKYDEAEKIFGQSSSVKGSAVQKANTHRLIGNAQMKQKKYAEAIESYKESLRSNPKDEYARYNLAEAMRKQKAQKEQQQKQDKQDQKNQQDQKNNPGQKDQGQQGKDNQGKPEDQPAENKSQPAGQKQQQGNSQQGSSGQQNKNKLSDKKTERMLDNLMKQEMETKKKFEGVRSTGSTKKSGKDW